MSTNELNLTAKNLLSLREQIAQLQQEAEALTDALKAAMVERETETLSGDGWTASWKNVQSSRFDAAKFRKEHPEAANLYMRTTTVTRFLLA